MSRIESRIAERIVSKIDIEELTNKIAEKVAEKILERDLGILDVPPSIPNPSPITPRPYDPWRDNIVVMYGVTSTPYTTEITSIKEYEPLILKGKK